MDDRKKRRSGILILIVLLLIGLILFFVVSNSDIYEKISLNKVLEMVKKQEIKEALIRDNLLLVKSFKGECFSTVVPYDTSVIDLLVYNGIELFIEQGWDYNKPLSTSMYVFRYIMKFLSSVVFLVFFLFIHFKSTAKKFSEETEFLTFKDVPGMKESVEDLEQIVRLIKNVKELGAYDIRIPKGVLLFGPPGNGKTRLAKAVAGETSSGFLFCSGSEFDEKYVGVGASRVRDLFEKARELAAKKGSCIIFIDEVDSVGASRKHNQYTTMHSNQTINQLLTEMDGMSKNENPIVVIVSTNQPDALDEALIRPGRIDRKIFIGNPIFDERVEVINYYLSSSNTDGRINAKTIAKMTAGLSRAEISGIINEAKLFALSNKRRFIRESDITEAYDKVISGNKKNYKSREEDKLGTVYHESCHALVQHHFFKKGILPEIVRVTIVPRGWYLGYMMPGSEYDTQKQTREYLEAELMVFYAGRLGEEIFMGRDKTGIGCSSDLRRARSICERYVRYGLSDEYGQATLADDLADSSEAERTRFTEEITKLTRRLHEESRQLILQNKDAVERMAQALFATEVLDGKDVANLLEGQNCALTIVKFKKTI